MMRGAVLALLVSVAASQWAAASIVCEGDFRSGGFAVCTGPEAIRANIGKVAQGNGGPAFIAIPREFSGNLSVTAGDNALTLSVAPREWDISRIDGLPPGKVRARTPEEQRQVQEGVVKKNEAWKSRLNASHFAGGFIAPVAAEHRITGVFGSERILNGERAGRVHNGLDFAAPAGMSPAEFVGTEVIAPAAGKVALADPELYFEGGFVVLDHGHGVMSLFMHLDSVSVQTGQVIEQGEALGTVGSTGRSTGPHLHWGVRIDGAYVDPAALLLPQRQTASSTQR